jgi:glycosidase
MDNSAILVPQARPRTGTVRPTAAAVMSVALAALALAGCEEPRKSPTYEFPPPAAAPRPVIYQLVVRLFGNVNGTNAWNGDLVTNGVGKFADIDDAAIAGLAELGVTHVWLTGVPQQATDTDWSAFGQPPDDPDVLKGRAGSFYAVRDWFDVCPDYADDPAQRMDEFRSLVDRLHGAGMKVLLDFVPNHVARTYHSDVRPDLDFGAGDDTSAFFHPQNDLFYLVDPPGQALVLPEPSHWPRPQGADGTLGTEDNDGVPPGDVPRATGNNVTSPAPSEHDWYETIKLNWGFDFASGTAAYDPVPGTWLKMDEVLAFWQEAGVDGFRCDFAHYVPLEAWTWLVTRARQRDPGVFFAAEAYDAPDAAPGFSFGGLIQSGFDATYDDGAYDIVKGVTCCGKWANDLDAALPGDFLFPRALRYAENHDERRIASPVVPGDNPDDSGFGGFEAGKPATGLLFLLGPGPVLIFNGQEVGEEGAGAEGFGGDDGRTTIFDYWTMPRLAEWVNGHLYDGGGLSEPRRELRRWYGALVGLAQREGLATGNFYGLQFANKHDPAYTSGQWLYAFLRYDSQAKAAWLVIANLGGEACSPSVRVPDEALQFAGLAGGGTFRFHDAFDPQAAAIEVPATSLATDGVPLTLGPHELAVFGIDRVE